MAEIEPRDVKGLITWLTRQQNPSRPGQLLSKSTITGHVAVLRAMLADATEEGVIRSNPAAGVRISVPEGQGTGREPTDERRALTCDELGALLGEVPPRSRLLFELLVHSGLRIGEAVELRWRRDVVFGDRPYLRIRWQFADGKVCAPKTKHGMRDIPLSHGLARKLWQARAAAHGRDGELVFRTTTGTRLSRHNLYRDALGPASRRAGVPWATLHTFRHTCASLLFAAPEQGGGGKNVKQVQKWLGHHSPAFTLETYVHLMDDGIGGADFLDATVTTAPASSIDASTVEQRREAAR